MLPRGRISAHPGKVLAQEFLAPAAMTQAELARRLNISPQRLNKIIRGRRGITTYTALRLAAYFKNSPEFWMNLQTAYDLSKALQERRRRGAA
jgi:addiction module HigA family antidote